MEGIKERIFKSAISNLMRFGMRKTTIADIAKDAGIGKGTIYNYFSSKSEIFTELAAHEGKQYIAKMEQVVAEQKDFIEKFKAFLVMRFQYVRNRHRFLSATQDVIYQVKPHVEATFAYYFEQEQALLRQIFEEAVATGEYEMEDIPLAAFFLSHAIQGLEASWVFKEPDIDLEPKVDILVRMWVNGLKKR